MTCRGNQLLMRTFIARALSFSAVAAVGQTNIVFFDSEGKPVAAYDIAVKRDLNGVRAALKQTLPYSGIQIEGVGDGVMLTCSVLSPIEAQQASDLAARLMGV